MEQMWLAWTHGQVGMAEKIRLNCTAAEQAYAKSVEMFEKLDQNGALTDPSFRARLNQYRMWLAVCRKAEPAVNDLDFALKQPANELPGLLDLRLRLLLKELKLPEAVATAAKLKELAASNSDLLYSVAGKYALCAGAAANADASEVAKRSAEEAIALLKQAVAKGYKNAAKMKEEKDLDALRDREDFRRLVADLEAAIKESDREP
jgi:hypothetical protein